MNNQTQGPVIVIGNRWKYLEIGGEANGLTIALGDSLDDKRVIPTAALLAAAYTSYDKAGRELGIDATNLARSLDLAALIRAAKLAANIIADEYPASDDRREAATEINHLLSGYRAS